MRLGISIVAYNRPALLFRALASLEAQHNKNWQLVLVNDNSSNPDVEPMAIAFVKQYHGVYINSKISDEHRLEKARGGTCINLAIPHLKGDVFLHIADDMELASPDAVGIILDHFENHPESKAGYFGIGYRLADYRTGHIYAHEETEEFFRGAFGDINPDEYGTGGFVQQDVVIRRYQPDFHYGSKLSNIACYLDGGQITYRREVAFHFPENPEVWLGEDAVVFQEMANYVGGLDPIGDVNVPLVYSNINEASLTVQRDPAKSIAVTNQQYMVENVRESDLRVV